MKKIARTILLLFMNLQRATPIASKKSPPTFLLPHLPNRTLQTPNLPRRTRAPLPTTTHRISLAIAPANEVGLNAADRSALRRYSQHVSPFLSV